MNRRIPQGVSIHFDESVAVNEPVASVESAPSSFKATVDALSAADHEHWQLTGELPEDKNFDTTAALSPASAEGSEEPENKAAAAPADEEQPKVGETPDQKSERMQRRNERKWNDLLRESAANKAKADLLEKQIADQKAAAAPAKTEEKPRIDPNKPKRPRMDDPALDTVDKYEAKMDEYEELKAIYDSQTVEQRERAKSQEFEFKTASEKWETIKTSGRTKFKDFDAVAFNPKVPASLAAIVELQSREDGHELMYHLGKNPELAKEIAELTDIPGPYKSYAELTAQALKDPQFALMLGEKRGIAKAEIARLAKTLTKPRTATPKEIIARQGKPSGEVAVEANAGAVEDELADAVKRKDQDAYNRIMNKREMAAAGA